MPAELLASPTPACTAAANEDCNLYTYDMRRLASASCVHQVGGRVGGGRAWRVCAR